ncbi:NAD-dependent epimerase/dehydratase family protein [Clostridium folliculivorans]|uniref:NDP-sugar dehydratase or epimerase n=1 Tax=Clostridium folliculivorans TaxID=2886038 RepID=A0A9W5Y3Q8_9CLOT|nr:GDP-mannose 4,6-dehydratase [Clostridium folliculivorans]GKU25985.1 NDP-sugar dehydratase or epimerase [Clostridium folliculivorans]GKU28071.1 NDP-sugar dehydratase or epimerase [Clostridium folliculivorans]
MNLDTQNKRIMLTGGAGFIGSKLSEVLAKENKLLIYDNLRRNSIKDTDLLNENSITLMEGDILDLEFLKKVVKDFSPDIVVHLAAIAGVDTVISNPVETMKVNMLGTYNVLEAIKNYAGNISRFIDFSTSEVFGSHAYRVDEECNAKIGPAGEARWTYSASKLAGEHLTHSYYKQYGLKTVTVRPFNIYGPGQVGEGAIHKFILKAIKNEEIQIHGDGDQIRSWCYIDDFIEGIRLCLNCDAAIGNSLNIGNPKATITIEMLAKLIKQIASSNSNIIYIPKAYADVELRVPSIDKAKRLLGFNPKIDLISGLKRTIEWYRSLED